MVDRRFSQVITGKQDGTAAPQIPSSIMDSALAELRTMNTTVDDLRKDRRTPIAGQCGRCEKWRFLALLTAVRLKENGKVTECLLCTACSTALRQNETRSAKKRFDLDPEVISSIAKIYRRTTNGEGRGKKFKAVTVSLDDVLRLWVEQNGVCALSGAPMRVDLVGQHDFRVASIDRIDSAKGYEPGNIQWVCWGVNLMKQDMTLSTFLRWCCRVAAHTSPK